jgi:hypothetical protein
MGKPRLLEATPASPAFPATRTRFPNDESTQGAVIEETPDQRIIITVYKTSQIAKYLNRTSP